MRADLELTLQRCCAARQILDMTEGAPIASVAKRHRAGDPPAVTSDRDARFTEPTPVVLD